jgi:hypothetical protein
MNDNRDFYAETRNALKTAIEMEGRTLVPALPALGKSTGTIEILAESGQKAVIFTDTHKLYDQIENQCKKEGLRSHVLPSFHNHCSTGGKEGVREHGSEWARKFRAEYNKGRGGRELHENAKQIFGKELPCQSTGQCDYVRRLDSNLDDYDVLIGNYRHMFKPEYSDSRIVIIDEFPGDGVLTTLSSDDANNAILRYLAGENSLPFMSAEDILIYRHNLIGQTDHDPAVHEWLSGAEGTTFESVSWHREGRNPNVTAYGSLLVRAALEDTKLADGWSQAVLSDETVIVRSPAGRVHILPPLPFDESTNIVALDGTPSLEMWRAVLGDELEYLPFLSDEEKREWLDHLGLRIIQLSETTIPVFGDRNEPQTDYALIEEITRREGIAPFVVTSTNGFGNLRPFESDELVWEGEHYGNLKGRNDLDGRNPVLIIGSPQQSDRFIQKWAAIRGHSAARRKDEHGNILRGTKLDFGPIGNEILCGTRENEILQAAMRFSREVRDEEIRVYVFSCAIPEWVDPEVWHTEIKRWDDGKGMSQVVNALTHGAEWKTAKRTAKQIEGVVEELYGDDGIGYDQILKHLKRLHEEYNLIRCEGKRPLVWSNLRLEERGKHSIVSLRE